MVTIYYKDSLNARQNKPFIDFFRKAGVEFSIVDSLQDIEISKSERNYIFVGTMEFFEVFLKYGFNRNVVIVYRSRGVAPEESYLKRKSYTKYLILSLLERMVLRLSKHIITVSEMHKNHYIRKYNVNSDKICVIHNYLTKDSYSMNKTRNEGTEIVYVGGISKWQKIEKIREIFKRIEAKSKDVSFLVCTDRKYIDSIKKSFLGVENINFESYEDYSKLIKRISNSTAGIILRDENTVNSCSSPFKIIDYISAQLPLIMSPTIGDYSKIFEGERFVLQIEDTDDEEMVDGIIDFVKSMRDNMVSVKDDIQSFSLNKLSIEREIADALDIIAR